MCIRDREKDIDITFPENYHADLAGKAVVFKVKVHEVKEKEVPAMDDEFAKDVSEFDTLKDLKADLKKKITEERQKDADRVFEENLMNQVAENITADIPDVMAVSYTHLRTPPISERGSPSSGIWWSICGRRRPISSWSIISVSYTHLDVYKRTIL